MTDTANFFGSSFDIKHGMELFLAVRGDDLDPSVITKVVGIKPHQQYRKGELVGYMTGERPAPTGLWLLQAEGAPRRDLSAHVCKLLDKPARNSLAWRNAVAKWERVLCVQRDPMATRPPVELNQEALAMIAALDCRLEIHA